MTPMPGQDPAVRNLMPALEHVAPPTPPGGSSPLPSAPLGSLHELEMWRAEAAQPGADRWQKELGKLPWWLRYGLLCTLGARMRHPDLRQLFKLAHLKVQPGHGCTPFRPSEPPPLHLAGIRRRD